MREIIDFPCIPFAQLPTPLYKLENLSREIGKNVYIKRDDMTGVALGGNKVRKLEFLLADARDKGADVVLTAGGPQSNHAMLTAACAAKLGMSAILVLKKRGVLSGGNLILDEIFGAEVRFVDTDSYDGVYAEMERIMADLRAQGHTPYFIPVGGSVPLGSLGYVNCALEKEEYQAFWRELCGAEEAEVHGFEDKNVFEGCMPVEVMARRGEDTLRYGPLKPRGLKDPSTGREPYAVVQLRKDNAGGSIYNLVGFQTHLKFGEQKRVFSMIPALRNAEYVRYGVMHRNTYLDSPRLLDRYYRLRSDPRITFAGQMTGVEGYVESAASGFLAAVELARRLVGKEPINFPRETALGALSLYVSDETVKDFQPMNINFGIISPLGHKVRGKRNKNLEISQRSLEMIERLKPEVLG